jgi:hypothetical protein
LSSNSAFFGLAGDWGQTSGERQALAAMIGAGLAISLLLGLASSSLLTVLVGTAKP